MKYARVARIIASILAVIALAFGGLLFFLVHGVPLHDFRLWRLEKSFKAAAPLYHPSESMLLQKKQYLGGPYDHGGLHCDFFVGELRAAPTSKEEIRRAYNNQYVRVWGSRKQTPLRTLFFDEGTWEMELPLTVWWGEWYESPLLATSSTVYFVYVSQEGYSFLGDMRCDD